MRCSRTLEHEHVKLGHTTGSIDKFIQLAIAGEVVGLAAAWVEHTFSRPGVRFVPVVDIEPAVTALAWRPNASLTEHFLAVARVTRGVGRPPPAGHTPRPTTAVGVAGLGVLRRPTYRIGLPPADDATCRRRQAWRHE